MPTYSLAPRISVILGVDSLGQSYLSLTQANSNSSIIEIFLRELVKKLDVQRPDWRSDTVLLFDNASYHTSEATLGLMEQLAIPVMFFGPYSYNVAPCELWFGLFKQEDINPRHVPQGAR